MRLAIAVLGTAGLVSLLTVLLILARLTQRWEAVTRARSYYRLFYLAAALVALASLVRLVRIGYLTPASDESALPVSSLVGLESTLSESQSWLYLGLYHLPLALGITISLILSWRTWGWLLKEQDDRKEKR